jgi:hypothetical protein
MLGCVVYLDGSLDVGDEADTDVVGSTDSTGSESGADEPTTDDPTVDGEATTEDDPGDGCAEAIDIMFVVDNSGSMGTRQRQVAEAIETLVNQLDVAGMDWRIAVTTTDNGNPWCPAGTTTPKAGRFVASSCRDRLGDFLFSDTVDVQDAACNEVCNHADIEIASNVIDGVVRDGAWVQRIDGQSNTFVDNNDGLGTVPLDPIEALKCILPQGVNGCGFESQLESMHLALARTADENELSFGFLRPEAQLAVVIITDETDCSYNKDWADIFSQDGNKVFWSSPDDAFPTSAMCWNAGVQCTGDGPEYDDCVAVDKDIDGNIVEPAQSDSAAVLHPLSRYTGVLNQLQDAKQAIDPDAKVKVFGIMGVDTFGEVAYVDVDAVDPEFQSSFGIGPGCTGDGEGNTGVPPVRMGEVIGEFEGSLHSVCKTQYIDAFKTIANRVTAECGQ